MTTNLEHRRINKKIYQINRVQKGNWIQNQRVKSIASLLLEGHCPLLSMPLHSLFLLPIHSLLILRIRQRNKDMSNNVSGKMYKML